MCLVSIHFQPIEWYVCTMGIYVLVYLYQVIAKTNLSHPKRIYSYFWRRKHPKLTWLFQVGGYRCLVVPSNRLVQPILLRQVLSYDKTVGGWACHRFQSTEGCIPICSIVHKLLSTGQFLVCLWEGEGNLPFLMLLGMCCLGWLKLLANWTHVIWCCNMIRQQNIHNYICL